MQTIIPAILETDLFEIKRKFDLVKNECDLIQIDVCDGEFVTSKTWPYFQKNFFQKLIEKVFTKTEPIFNKSIPVQLDIMAWSTIKELQDIGKIFNVKSLVLGHDFLKTQYENTTLDYFAIFDQLNTIFISISCNYFDNYTIEDVKSLSFNYIDNLKKEGKDIGIQVMGIKHIGKQHEPFDTSCLDTIKKLRSEFPDLIIQVDGGMNETTIPLVLAAGANRVVVGSAIFGAGNPVENLKKLQSLV